MNLQEFSTSYIARELPWPRIDLDGDSVDDIPAPFKKVILQKEFLGTKELQLRNEIYYGQSSKTTDFRVKPMVICSNDKSPSDLNKLNNLYMKAKLWCETNEHLVEQQKSHQHGAAQDPNVLSDTFSDVHREVVKSAKQDSVRDHVDNFLPPTVNKDGQIDDGGFSYNDNLEESSKETALRSQLKEILGDATPLKQLETSTESKIRTQYNLITTDPVEIEAKAKYRPPKPFWKKNKYPLQSRRQVIAERRKLTRPLTAEELELDYLPGIWEPQLIVNEFTITGITTNTMPSTATAVHGGGGGAARTGLQNEDGDKDEDYEAINWYEKQARTEKCVEWLKSIRE